MKAGIYDMSMPDYLRLDALSSGVAAILLNESPCHAMLAKVGERGYSKTADLGTCAHAVLLEGDESSIAIIHPEDNRSKPTKNDPEGSIPTGWTNGAMRASRDAAIEAGKVPILPDDMGDIRSMVKAAQEYVATSAIKGVFDSGKPERTIIWQEGDIWCKARPDWLSDRFLLHFKTTQASVAPRAFSRIAAGSGYDLAMMFYVRGLNAVDPDNQVEHVLLAQEQASPFACKLFDLSNTKADIAERRIDKAIKTWAECTKTNQWPLYGGDIYTLDAQNWEVAAAEEELLGDGEGGVAL